MLYSSFKSLISNIPQIKPLNVDIDKYWAHIPSEKNLEKPNEPLQDHIKLVNETALKLIRIHDLENLIDNLISNFCYQIDIKNTNAVANFIKEVFISTIMFHDYGKVNENFQVEKMGNPNFISKKLSIGSQHSILSAYLFINYYVVKTTNYFKEQKEQIKLARIICAFSDTILRHHSPVIDIKKIGNHELSSELKSYLPFIGLEKPFEHIDLILRDKKKIQQKVYDNKDIKDYPLYTLIKINFSLLTAADYLATLSYQKDVKLPDSNDKRWWGILSDERKSQLLNQFINSAEYNKQALANLRKQTKNSAENYHERTQNNLNVLRSMMLDEVIQTLRNNIQERLFYLKAPTGAGKTNISLAIAMDIISKDKSLNKVFYVFPFTTLITQTYKSITQTLKLSPSEIVQLHSKAEWNKRNAEEKKDGLYEADWENHIENLFVHYPFTLLSHIKFFDVLKGNKKEANYLLHRFSNSIVIIDELQSYSPKFWDHINYFITHYANALNMRFILMSATLPEIGKLALNPRQKWIDLISKPEKYFQNENFSGRTKFDFSLLEKEKAIDLNFLSKFIAEKGKQYANENSGMVKIICEFIIKKTASDFYQIASKEKNFSDYSILILSGSILSPRREEIVNNLQSKKWLKNNPKVLIISTQVVEAGVDIDMDIGFKDTSLIDSDEQLAGRVNRNAKKNNSKVYLFNINKEDSIYRNDERIEFQKSEIDIKEHELILKSKEFNRLYDKIIDKHLTNRSQLIRKFDEYLEHLQFLRYGQVDKEFKLIDNSSGSVFIPLELKIEVFSKSETILMKKMDIISDEDKRVQGKILFNSYEKIILNRMNNFIIDRDNIIKFQSLLSKFTISLFKSAIDQIEEIELENGNEEPYKFGYLYFSNFNKYYNYKEGLNLPSKNNKRVFVF